MAVIFKESQLVHRPLNLKPDSRSPHCPDYFIQPEFLPALHIIEASSLETMEPLFLILHCLLYGK